jgi:hypothetical protein
MSNGTLSARETRAKVRVEDLVSGGLIRLHPLPVFIHELPVKGVDMPLHPDVGSFTTGSTSEE